MKTNLLLFGCCLCVSVKTITMEGQDERGTKRIRENATQPSAGIPPHLPSILPLLNQVYPPQAGGQQPRAQTRQISRQPSSSGKRQKVSSAIPKDSTSFPTEPVPVFDYSLEYGSDLHRAIYLDHLDVVTKAILSGKVDISKRNSLGKKIIHLAARAGAQNLVRFLAEYGVSIHEIDNEGQSPLYHALATFISSGAVSDGKGARAIIFYFLSLGACLTDKQNDWLNEYGDYLKKHLLPDYPLLQAVISNKQEVDQNSFILEDLQLAFVYAAAKDRVELIEWLTKIFAPEEFKGLISKAFTVAATHNSINALETLFCLAAQLTVEEKSAMLKLGYHAASSQGSLRAVSWILEHDSNLPEDDLQSLRQEVLSLQGMISQGAGPETTGEIFLG